MTIRIKSDFGEVYECGQEITLETLKKDYEEANWIDNDIDTDSTAWDGWTEQEILKFIAGMWGIDYEIIS
jgi:hypothetical protein